MTREEAIDLLDNLIGMIEDNHNSDYDTALKIAIKALKQEPKTGHWIIYDVHGHKACKCSECDKDVGYPCNDNFCPFCGAKMFEPRKSEVNT